MTGFKSCLKFLPAVLSIFYYLDSFAQDDLKNKKDSLRIIITSGTEDTTVINALNEMTRLFLNSDNYDSALKYCNEAIERSGRANFRKGLSNALSDRGVIYGEEGNYPEAIKNYQSALKLNEELGDKKAIANSYNYLANTYHVQGDFPNALKNQYSALRLREEINDKQGIAWSYNNIGIIYKLQGNLPEALKNYLASLRILEELGDKKTIATSYNNLGNLYSEQGNYEEALKNYYTSLSIRQEIGDKRDISTSYNNIGDIFCDMYEKNSNLKEIRITYPGNDMRTINRDHWLDSALSLQSKALSLNDELNDKYFSIFSLSGIGRINYLRGNYAATISYYKKAYAIADEMKALDLQKEIAQYLSNTYAKLNDYKNEMLWYKTYSMHKDSLYNEEKTQDLTRTQMKYEFEKKESEAIAAQEKKDELAKAELNRQKRMRNITLGGLALVLLFAGVFFYQRNHIRNEKTRSDNLLLNILPSEIASELKETGVAKTKYFKEATVLFADFVDFTVVSERVSPELLVNEIHVCFSAFDNILQKHKVEKIKTIGDAYLCAGGIPLPDPEHAIHIINAAFEINDFMKARKKEKELKNEIPFEVRIGIHSGPVVAGIVGVRKYAYDIWGDTVNIAARMEQNSEPGKINISSSTYELVKEKFKCTYRGKIEAKNKGMIDMYFIEANA